MAPDGKGTAYVGTLAGNLRAVGLADGKLHAVSGLPGTTALRVETRRGAGKAYAVGPQQGGRLYAITLTDGAGSVAATGLGTCEGLASDIGGGRQGLPAAACDVRGARGRAGTRACGCGRVGMGA
ncbi:hypothetical protein ACSNOK_27820 [Streptomyces sp. URMC 126]|uniref:hypothetical protein n=1 Tax=Streptomyces sp. URMC 126 TaxID=3423401 RepID=UPI003F1BDDB6